MDLKIRLIDTAQLGTEEVQMASQLREVKRQAMEPRLEKRQYPRRQALYEAKYSIPSGTYRDSIANVSAGGIYIHSYRTVEDGQRIRLRFPVIAFDQRPSVTGTVVRSQESGFAVIFDKPILDKGSNGVHLPENHGV